MAPTSLPGQKTTSSPFGRNTDLAGYPIKVSEILAQTEGAAYVVRRSLHDVANIRKAKKAILTALKVQQARLGFSMVELLSTCPTNWGLTPEESLEWVRDEMVPFYPLGDYKVIDAVKGL
jgi:2-oxoglutarate ferredoxin oxidoreductase subunit beta